MEDAHTFGGWLKQQRKRLRLTQRELAGEVGYAEVTLRKVEADELRPSREMAQRLAEALHIPAAERAQFLHFARDEAEVGQAVGSAVDPGAPILHPRQETANYPARIELVTLPVKIDWGEAPDVSGFQGRQLEVDRLRQWLTADRCRVVAVLGMGGIGKTALAVFAAANVQEQFTAVIWRSLRNAPPPAELLRQWIQLLSPYTGHELPSAVDQLVALLMEHLRGQRCLLILDNFETVLAGERPDHYLPGYEGYGYLLKQMGEGRCQSCLLLTSREKPRELIPLAGENAPVRTLVVSGLQLADGRALLQDRHLRGSAEEWAALHALYSGNPLALQITAEAIHELFHGDLGRFLRQETFLFSGIADLLAHQRTRLSSLEQEIMFWLAVEREPVTPGELAHDLVTRPTETAVLAALHTLRHRFLVESTQTGFTLQNVVLEYFTATLIEQVCAEIEAGSADLLQRYALFKASARSYVRESQRSLILGPVARWALQQLGSLPLAEHLNTLLARLRSAPSRQVGYAGGNILNLMVQSGIDLRGQDFSQLAVWQADLRGVPAQAVNFRQADLSQSAFTDTFANVSYLAFSPDGQRVAAATMSGEIRVWQVRDGKPLATWSAHRGWGRSVCFSPDGSKLASASSDQTVRLWNAEGGRLVTILQGHTSDVLSVCFSPDGSIVASGSDDRTARLWDTHTGECLRVLQGHTAWIWSVCFSPDGSVLASGGHDRTVRLWDTHTGECLRVLQGHTITIGSVCFSPDGSVLASGSYDQTIRLWDTHTGDCLYVLQGHTNALRSVCFSPDGSVLASGGYDQTVRLWNWRTGECLRVLQGHTSALLSVCFSPDGSVLASGGNDQTIRLWDRHAGKCLRVLQGYTNSVFSVCFSPDGSVLASGSDDRAVRLWDTHTGECLRVLQGHTNLVLSVCFSPDGSVLASGSDDRTVRLWDRHTGKCLYVLQGHTSALRSVCFSPDSNILASGGYDQIIRLWDTHTGECLRVLQGHTNALRSVCFSPDGNILASGSNDQTIRLWNRDTGECLRVLQGHTSALLSVCFSPDGSVLASGSNDETVRLWDRHTGECLYVLQGHTGWVGSVCFSPDGNILASGSNDKTVRLWDRHTGECLRVLQGHMDWVSSVCFSPDGSVLASSSNDETIRLWGVNTGVCRKVLHSERPYEGMNITAAVGLTPVQIATLKRLGAVEDADLQNADGASLRV